MKNLDRSIYTVLLLLIINLSARAQATGNLAPGAPGKDAHWESADKAGVGTSNTLQSKVWFTLGRDGAMTEVYYPTIDTANVQTLQFIVVSNDGKRIELESEASVEHHTESIAPHALTFRQTNTAKSGAWKITKTYITDPERSAVLINVRFEARTPHKLYVYYDPSLNNSGMHDSAWTQGGALLASDADKSSALVSSVGFDEITNGYSGTSDGLTQLRQGGRIPNQYVRAPDGNVVQVARVHGDAREFTLALGFGKEPDDALDASARASQPQYFARARAKYEAGWDEWVKSLRRVDGKYQRQFDMAAMILKAHEDKTFRGAMVASLSVPWGGGTNANEPTTAGYHLVWPRDLYHVVTAFYAMGDKAAADRALNYLFTVQQKPDGTFPQNSWLDGRVYGDSLQMDEIAYPLISASQLGRTDNATWTQHVKPAADYLVAKGPYTLQERWEEKSGYSPSTIAAEIAGLVCAADIARRNGAEAMSKKYLAIADDWAKNVERWTATTNGKYGDGAYYVRLTEKGEPDGNSKIELNNNAGRFLENEIVDAGFLELVRLGIKRPDDSLIAKSLAVTDRLLKVETPNGASWYRYNHDGYGEMDDGRPWNFDGKYTGRGRLWALLAGERGEYELARGDKEAARKRLDAMLGFANEGMMIPEQVWDHADLAPNNFRFGEGTGSATPLAWSMAQFIRLAVNLHEGRNIETPAIVAEHFQEAFR